MSSQNRSSFTGKIGFVLAAAGSAVGLGNIWRFPYLAAKYGGGMFLLVYILLMLFWGLTDLSGTLVLLVLGLGQLICLAVTHRNAAIHDLLAGTAVADFSSQMIFDSTEALIEFQKKVHAERAARAE